MIELTPNLEPHRAEPIYIQLTNYIKDEIKAGRINPKEKLPSKRKLASHLEISLNTVQAAYDQLTAEGYLESYPRKGIYVAPFEENLPVEPNSSQALFSNETEAEKIQFDFNHGKVDVAHFPFTIWRKLTIQALYQDQGELINTVHPQGDPFLREEIAHYLYSSRGVRCSTEQIIMGAGTQVLMGLLLNIIGKNQHVVFEEPGFHRTKAVVQDYGMELSSIPLDENGIIIEKLYQSQANVVYVTPSHQFPNGMVMPISRRVELLKWAEERDGIIIEDDYDGEFRYRGKPIPSLQGLDTNDRVVYLGTFSKALIPSIRIGYMVLPLHLLKRYKEHFTIYKQTASQLHQDTLYRFMKDGYWQTHLNKMRTLYRKKHKTLMTTIQNVLGEGVSIYGEKSGLHIVLEIKSHMTEEELVSSALEAGVKVYPLAAYYADSKNQPKLPRILLGFGGLSEADIEQGILLLKQAWKL